MTETSAMHARLRVACGLGWLVCMAACEPVASPRQHELELAKQREAAAREAEQAAVLAAERARVAEQARLLELASREAEREREKSCPSGEWCGSQTIAEQYRGEAEPDHPDTLGCPGHLASERDASEREHVKGHPPRPMSEAYLDVAATRANMGGLCCYDWTSPCERP